jgi:hypothetical protein
MLLIDPPSGWRYGFPKPFDNPTNMDTTEWLLANGYPASELGEDGKAHWVRFIGNHDELIALDEEDTLDEADNLGDKGAGDTEIDVT